MCRDKALFTWHGTPLPRSFCIFRDPATFGISDMLPNVFNPKPSTTRPVDECLGPDHLSTSWRDGPRLASTKRLWSIRRNKTTPKAWASPRAMRVALVRNRRLTRRTFCSFDISSRRSRLAAKVFSHMSWKLDHFDCLVSSEVPVAVEGYTPPLTRYGGIFPSIQTPTAHTGFSL